MKPYKIIKSINPVKRKIIKGLLKKNKIPLTFFSKVTPLKKSMFFLD